MEIGIVGLPFSGKTTLFSTLTGLEVKVTHIMGKFEAHRGTVKVPDERLDKLFKILQPKRQVNATIEYIEVGGLESQQTKGKGFDPQFLAILKTTQALCLVLQAFENEAIPHPEGSVDPLRDLRFVESEFILSDLSIVENRLARLEKQILQSKSEEDIRERELLRKFRDFLEQGKPLREFPLHADEQLKIRGFQFLSAKPLLIVVNYGESQLGKEDPILQNLAEFYNRPQLKITGLCAKIESEISQLAEADRQLFLEEMKIKEPAFHKIIHESYRLLGLISFFTFNENECRSWHIPAGTPAQKAAGTVHTDMERGFIRAEVVNYNDFIKYGSVAHCREHGILRLEGKDYIVQDGDMMTIRFHV
jgi:GTP-binding protein YchF